METRNIKCEKTKQAMVKVRRCIYGVNLTVFLVSLNIKAYGTKKVYVASAGGIK